jgi:hypothetical protein
MNQISAALAHDRQRLLARSGVASITWHQRKSELAAALDALLDWSAGHATASTHEQESVEFRRRADDRVFWKAYPAGRASDPKVEFLVRAHVYLEPAVWAGVAEQWAAAVGTAPVAGRVLSLPLARLADPARFARLRGFLEWAAAAPELAVGAPGT